MVWPTPVSGVVTGPPVLGVTTAPAGQVTEVLAPSLGELAELVADAVAVLLYAWQLAVVVALVTWTEALAPPARVPKAQVRVWPPPPVVIMQVPGPV